MIKIGQPAPEFTLEAAYKDKFEKVSLKDYKGKWTVLFFYPLDFTFVCPTEITEFSKRTKEFDECDTKVLGASVDSVHSHKAWLKDLGELNYPLLSDMTKQVSRDYGVLLEEEGITLRGTFIIDPEGIVRYQLIHDNNIGRNVEEILRVLKALQSGGLCPAGWQPGDDNLKG
ncbi:peroxiredoxin [bacterium]|mgnify:FL=1|jgi:peroxiredoxin 2/4|nr:peroxiredoxin [bacterium]MBT4495320.1 peroxiredoxin [bacterium]MBT4763762.1 peroxiredoxin [bacterium]MBT5401132.1 peroxiredoxin [bacterium]MBT5942908.1 peroxiredoxin [bacterium]